MGFGSQRDTKFIQAGVVLSNVWGNEKIVAVDELGSEFLEYVQDDMAIEIKEDGTIIVTG